jgi:hypothetical protein
MRWMEFLQVTRLMFFHGIRSMSASKTFHRNDGKQVDKDHFKNNKLCQLPITKYPSIAAEYHIFLSTPSI